MLNAALSFGLALAVLAASFGHISGVHFNPSVTIGVLIAGEMQATMAVLYVVVQLLGGKQTFFPSEFDCKKSHQVLPLRDFYVYYLQQGPMMHAKVELHF